MIGVMVARSPGKRPDEVERSGLQLVFFVSPYYPQVLPSLEKKKKKRKKNTIVHVKGTRLSGNERNLRGTDESRICSFRANVIQIGRKF